MILEITTGLGTIAIVLGALFLYEKYSYRRLKNGYNKKEDKSRGHVYSGRVEGETSERGRNADTISSDPRQDSSSTRKTSRAIRRRFRRK